MAFEMDTLDMDFQIDHAFGVLYSKNLAGCVDAAAIFAGEEDRDILEYLHVPDPMLFVMERELFALVAWTLILTADLEKGRFAAPFMNAVHCFEAKTICSLERDPRNYFEDERCAVLAPPIVKDVDTALLCCVENDVNPPRVPRRCPERPHRLHRAREGGGRRLGSVGRAVPFARKRAREEPRGPLGGHVRAA